MAAVEDPDKYGVRSEGLQPGTKRLSIKAFAIKTESDDRRLIRTRAAQQVHARTVAIIDLHVKLAAEFDLGRFLVDNGHGATMTHQHLRHRLTKTAIADDERRALRPLIWPVDILFQFGRASCRERVGQSV